MRPNEIEMRDVPADLMAIFQNLWTRYGRAFIHSDVHPMRDSRHLPRETANAYHESAKNLKELYRFTLGRTLSEATPVAIIEQLEKAELWARAHANAQAYVAAQSAYEWYAGQLRDLINLYQA